MIIFFYGFGLHVFCNFLMMMLADAYMSARASAKAYAILMEVTPEKVVSHDTTSRCLYELSEGCVNYMAAELSHCKNISLGCDL